MPRKVRHKTLDEWKKLIEQADLEGIEYTVFCERHSLIYKTFSSARSRLGLNQGRSRRVVNQIKHTSETVRDPPQAPTTRETAVRRPPPPLPVEEVTLSTTNRGFVLHIRKATINADKLMRLLALAREIIEC